ncbi:MAG: T9SS type A sorting domain-containing protein [Candidatus Aegiribacteria sp.]|nr:T9SS type A sorting domain-containing protein [Candidatus Aegiribacteria sp.]MBD3295522.1 T9SS type A sorting domain-containing protein [Candidatus Fermentibacteria bacterium]
MTGLATVNSSYVYLSSRAQNSTYRYYASTMSSRYHYISYSGASQTRDIAMNSQGEVWVATDWTSMPLRLYDTSDQMVDHITSSLVPGARGVTMDAEGYLWVSDVNSDTIYKLDLTEGVEGSGEESTGLLQPSENPFSSQVTVTGSGFGSDALITVYDIRGNVISSDEFSGTFTVGTGSSLDNGVYFVKVNDGLGRESVLRLTCL